jgi:hypothetical protein
MRDLGFDYRSVGRPPSGAPVLDDALSVA